MKKLLLGLFIILLLPLSAFAQQGESYTELIDDYFVPTQDQETAFSSFGTKTNGQANIQFASGQSLTSGVIWLKRIGTITSNEALTLTLYEKASAYVTGSNCASQGTSKASGTLSGAVVQGISTSGDFYNVSFSSNFVADASKYYCLESYYNGNTTELKQGWLASDYDAGSQRITGTNMSAYTGYDTSGFMYRLISLSFESPTLTVPQDNFESLSSTVSLYAYCVRQVDTPASWGVRTYLTAIAASATGKGYKYQTIYCDTDVDPEDDWIAVGSIGGLWNDDYYFYVRQEYYNPDSGQSFIVTSGVNDVNVNVTNNPNNPPTENTPSYGDYEGRLPRWMVEIGITEPTDTYLGGKFWLDNSLGKLVDYLDLGDGISDSGNFASYTNSGEELAGDFNSIWARVVGVSDFFGGVLPTSMILVVFLVLLIVSVNKMFRAGTGR